MKLTFALLSSPYRYPLSAAEAKHILNACVPTTILSRLAAVHFGCNRRTTQEARIVARGATVEIRINFCPRNAKTPLLSTTRAWIEGVQLCGGIIDSAERCVTWTPEAARAYVTFLLAHEIAHLTYAEWRGHDTIHGVKSSAEEEAWCDAAAKATVNKLAAGMSSA